VPAPDGAPVPAGLPEPDALLVHDAELGTKGGARAAFTDVLRRNLVRQLGMGPGAISSVGDRILVDRPGPDALDGVARTFGVAHATPVWAEPADLDRIVARAVALATSLEAPVASFAVRARRARTAFAVPSPEVEATVGSAVAVATGWPVSLRAPACTVHVEVVGGRAWVGLGRVAGPGGLPVGVSGHVVALVSAGIDSPVAAWRLLHRGAAVVAVHCHAQPFTDRSSERKAGRLVAELARWGLTEPWWSVPIGEAQRELVIAAPDPLRTLLTRRLILRVGAAIAATTGARALVTGDSLGQVASQTLSNLAAVDAAVDLPVLRPLVGDDKAEITARARVAGTYDISAEPHQDCCTLFEPRRPATRSTGAQLDRVEEAVDVGALVAACVAAAVRRDPCAHGPTVDGTTVDGPHEDGATAGRSAAAGPRAAGRRDGRAVDAPGPVRG
jgi:tRNA uracil 4-sulfurtransferase